MLLALCVALVPCLAAERHECDPGIIDLAALSRLRVDVADSPDCIGGDNGRQILESAYEIPGCRGCGYTISFQWDDRIEGLRPFMDTLWVGRTNHNGTYFLGYYQTEIGTGLSEYFCGIDTRGNEATLNVHGTDRIVLGYDTIDGRYHIDCYAAITQAELLDVVDHHGDILYERVSQGETNQIIPWVTNPVVYPEEELRWSLTTPLDCTIDEVTGVITLGALAGTITLRAYNLLQPECFIEVDIKVCDEGCSSGDGPCDTTAGGGTASLRSVDLIVGMGATAFGRNAGAFRLHHATPSPELYSPSALAFHPGAPGVEVIRGTNGVRTADGPPLQVRTPEALGQVVAHPDGSSYAIEFYRAADFTPSTNASGLFDTIGPPHRTWSIRNPDTTGSTATEVLITDSSPGRTNLSHYLWDPLVSGWELRTDGARRREKRWWTTNGLARTETYTLHDEAGRLYNHQTVTYRRFAWGDALVERTIGTGPDLQVTTWTYYDDPATDGVNYGRLRQVTFPDGHWERFTYDALSRVIRQVNQFLDLPPPDSPSGESSNRVTTITYFSEGEERVVHLNGVEVAHDFHLNFDGEVWDVRCQSRDADLNAPDNLVTITTLRRTGPEPGEPERIRHPDGTLSLFSTARSPDGRFQTNIVTTGQPSPSGTAIVDGTRTLSVIDAAGHALSESSVDVASGLVTDSRTALAFDADGRPTLFQYLDGTVEEFVYGCCGLESHTDRDGVTVTYEYDFLGRTTKTTRDEVSWHTDYDPAGRPIRRWRTGFDGTVLNLTERSYDTAGRLVEMILPDNGSGIIRRATVSEIRDARGHTVRTTTQPDGGTRIETFAQDGSLLSVAGSAVPPVRFVHGVDAGGEFTIEIHPDDAGNETEWTTTYRDMLGRHDRVIHADGAVDQVWHDLLGRVWKHVDPDGVTTRFFYNGRGELEFTAVDMDQDDDIAFAGVDRLTQTVSDVIANDLGTVARQRTFEWRTNHVATPTLVEIREIALQARMQRLTRSGLSHITTVVNPQPGQRLVTRTAPDRSTSSQLWAGDRLLTEESTHPDIGPLRSRNFTYDAHGRLASVVDARSGPSRFFYNPDDSLHAIEGPPATPGAPPPRVEFLLDPMGRPVRTLSPAGTVTNAFDLAGHLLRSEGDGKISRALAYDAQGRLRSLTTWQNPADPATAAPTLWHYDPRRGLPTGKTHADGRGPSLSRTLGGRILSRTWARGVTTTYGYNSAGDLASIQYSDSTPGFTYSYDRAGRLVGVTHAELATALDYDENDRLLREVHLAGPLAGLAVSYAHDSLGRLIAVGVSSLTETTVTYGYDPASRLETVTHGESSARYTRLQSSRLVEKLAFELPGLPAVTTQRIYDLRDRLTSITTSLPLSFSYQHDPAGRRIGFAREDGSHWAYQHDSAGHLISAHRYWADGSRVAGQQFEYGFDDAGNRIAEFRGGNPAGAGLRPSVSLVDLLGQPTARSVPGAVDLTGTAAAAATVTVNDQPALRQGTYFWHELSVDNSAGPAWLPVTNLAVLNDSDQPDLVAFTAGIVRLPPRTEMFTFDPDGNRVSDGRWQYTWDGENRLVAVESVPETPPPHRIAIEFIHDYAGRRVRRILKRWNGAAYQPTLTNLWVHSGNLPLAELNGARQLQHSFAWGLDISQSLQGARGVGGLLFTRDHASGSTQGVVSDGSGNVAALVDGHTGVVVARFDYGPFGEPIRASGPAASTHPFRFATKYTDPETGLLHFGHRDYDPSTGLWLSRDPLGEAGGLNLNAYAGNRPTDFIDPDGHAFYAFDGTDNDGERDNPNNPKARKGPTNVRILYELYRGERFYKSGVGTRDGLLNPLGLAFGAGGDRRIDEMMRALRDRIKAGDCDIDVTGFSRGAAMAREFVNRIHQRYPKLSVRWLGIFDTVASFGAPGNSVNLGYDLNIPDSVAHVLHLTAMDEGRVFFPLTSIQAGPHRPNPVSSHAEVAIPGAHSDIGGGYLDNRGLANKALFLMWSDGIRHKVPFNPIPAIYRDFSESEPHDSKWISDKVVDYTVGMINVFPFGVYGDLAIPEPSRKIYYAP